MRPNRFVASNAFAILLLLGLDVSSAQTTAPTVNKVSSEPEVQTSSFGDWTLKCQRKGESSLAQRDCELLQSIGVKGKTEPVVQIAFGKVAASDPLRVTVVTVPDISLPSSVRIGLDEKDAQPVELAWTRCLQIGCFATTAPSQDTLRKWRLKSDVARLSFVSASGQTVVVPVSFRGLSQALDALAREK